MINVSDLKPGVTFQMDGNLFVVLDYSHNKTARAAANIKVKMKNLRTGSTTEMTFGGNDKVKRAQIDKKEMQYLYNTGDAFVFMDGETYEQIEIPAVVFLFSAGYYVLIWQPLSERIEQQETMLQQLVAMNARLKSAAPDIIAARKSGTTTPAQVSRVISDSASAHSVAIKRIAERGENIQVWIDPVVFNDLLNWLKALDEKYALRVTQIDVSAGEKPGMVNVQRLEFGRG